MGRVVGNEPADQSGDEPSTPLRSTVVPPSTTAWDVICAYLHGEISEGRLREVMRSLCGWDGDQTRAAWFDAVERGVKVVENLSEYRSGTGTERVTKGPP